MANEESYSNIMQAYNGIQSNSSIIGDLLSKFVVNRKSVGYGVYNNTQYSNQIDLPRDKREYQTAMQAIEEDVSDISDLMSRIKSVMNNGDSEENRDLSSLYERLLQMKSDREDVRAMLYSIMNTSENMNQNITGSFNNGQYQTSGGGGYSGGGGSAPKQEQKQTQPQEQKTNNDIPSFTPESYKPQMQIQSKVSNDLGGSYTNVVNNKSSIGNLLSSFVVNGKSLGAGIYNDGKSNLGSDSVQLPTFDELQFALDTVRQDVADTKQLIENFKADIAALEADIAVQSAVPPFITVGSGTKEDPYVQVENPAYAPAQAKIAEDRAKIAEDTAKMNEMIEDLSKKEEVFNELLNYYNGLYKLVGKNMDLFVGWSLYKNVDMNGGKLAFGGVELSDAAAASIFATYLNKLQAGEGSYSLSLDQNKSGEMDFTKSDFKTILGAVSDAHQWFNYKLGKGPNPFEGSAQSGNISNQNVSGDTSVVGKNSGDATQSSKESNEFESKATEFNKPSFSSDNGTGSMEYKSDRYKLGDGKTVSAWSAKISSNNHPYLFLADQCSEYIPKGTEYTKSGPIADPLKMAQESGATLAINGGRLNAGPIVADSKMIRQLGAKTPHEVQGETLYMTSDGKLGALTNMNGNNYTAVDQLNQIKPEWALMGFHRVYDDGKPIPYAQRAINDKPNDNVRHPRTFIAQTYDGEYIAGVISGPRGSQAAGEPGVTIDEMTNYITSTYSNVKMIYNLDGGGSSFMYYNGHEVENITDSGNEWYSSGGHRFLPELICFK